MPQFTLVFNHLSPEQANKKKATRYKVLSWIFFESEEVVLLFLWTDPEQKQCSFHSSIDNRVDEMNGRPIYHNRQYCRFLFSRIALYSVNILTVFMKRKKIARINTKEVITCSILGQFVV